jgi:aldehyde:ferredoxin oxidoreductase
MGNDGYAGSILYVNLTEESIREKPYPDTWKRKYLGGRGLGVAIISEMVDPVCDPLGGENVLVFATGPLTGSGIPLGSRYDVITKSPLTGTLTSANSGGVFGTALKRAGYDAVVFSGSAERPLLLWVHDHTAELRDARHYWGMETGATQQAMKADYHEDHLRIACIGPAGERLCRMACIINDRGRAAGRGGVGAVMGAKYLKAVAAHGTMPVPPRDSTRLEDAKREIRRKLKDSGVATGSLQKYGTAGILHLINKRGILPTNNHRRGSFAGAEQVSGERMQQTIFRRRNPCYACIVGCGRITAVGETEGDGPEYETIWAMGPQCGADDLEKIALANYRCNELGLDTISTGSTIACAIELSEREIISERISSGDGEAVCRLVEMIGMREGIGDELAEGSYRFAEMYGHPEFSMSVKMQELPAYDPRGLMGMGLNYATSVRGGCHVYGNMVYPEVIGAPVKLDPFVTAGKAEWTKKMQDIAAAIDSSGICIFTERTLWAEDYAAMINAVTGFDLDAAEIFTIGERIWNLQKLFNLRAGFTRDDDTLPKRLMEEPLTEGDPAGRVWIREPLLSEYYAVRSWDPDGVPTLEKLRELGLK